MLTGNLTESNLGYLAGIIDGEGTVTLIRKHRNEMPSPEITIATTSSELLSWLATHVGCGHVRKKIRRSASHRQAFTWCVRGNKALDLLMLIKERLHIKKPHADIICSQYKKLTPRNGRYTAEMEQAKLSLFAEIKTLNKKGI